MNAITIGFRHDGQSEVIADTNVSPTAQVNAFRELTAKSGKAHPIYRRVELHTLSYPERFVNYDAPKAESKPTNQPQEPKGKSK